MKNNKYPVLRPVPIPTKGLSFWKRVRVWLFYSRKWEVVEDWYYDIPLKKKYKTVYIEKGFIFDGASIPRPLWPLLSPTGILLIPGLVHDYAYRYKFINIVDFQKKSLVRVHEDSHKYWDDIFRDIAVDINGMGVIDDIAHRMLILFGSSAWKKNRIRECN